MANDIVVKLIDGTRKLKRALFSSHRRSFGLLLLGQTISQFGDRAHDVALIWLVTGLTGSTLLIGSVLAASQIPMLLLLLIGGALADSVNQRTTILGTELLRA